MRTIPQLFEDSCKLYPDNVLIREKTGGEYQSISYQSIRQSVYSVASGLMGLGIQKGDEVILPTYVCTAVLNAVNYTGATPRVGCRPATQGYTDRDDHPE